MWKEDEQKARDLVQKFGIDYIIELWGPSGEDQAVEHIAAALSAARQEERERCAQVIEAQTVGGHCGEGTDDIIQRQQHNRTLQTAAAAIRALSDQP